MVRIHRLVSALMVFAAVGLAGCGAKHGGSSISTASQSASMPLPVPSVPAATKPLALLRWNLNIGEPLTVDTGKIAYTDDQLVTANMCEPLEWLLPSGKVQPALATSIVQTSPTSYVVHVRPGVKFWNGQAMTATDVAFSIERQLNPKLGSYYMLLTLGGMKSATATGPYTVSIQLTRPSSFFKALLETPVADVVEKSFVEAHGSSYGTPQVGPMCTGPYEFVNWTPGESITIKRFPGWWDAASQRRLTAAVKFSFVSDPNASSAALLNGELDGQFLVPAAGVARLRAGGGTLVNGRSTTMWSLDQSSNTGVGANVKIRQAVAHLVDYAGLVSSQFGETAAVARAMATPDSWGYSSAMYEAGYRELPAPSQDIASARKLVQESGLKHPVVTIATTALEDPDGATALVDQMQQAGAQAGITIVNRPQTNAEQSAMFTSASARKPYTFFYVNLQADVLDPLEFYNQLALPTGGENYGGYDNPIVTRLINQANATNSPAKRAALTVQAQKLYTQADTTIPIAWSFVTTYVGRNIGGVEAALPSDIYWPWVTRVGGR